jgi:hypothetical protein
MRGLKSGEKLSLKPYVDGISQNLKDLGSYRAGQVGTSRHPEHQSHFTKPKSELRQERKDPVSEPTFPKKDVKHFSLTTFET